LTASLTRLSSGHLRDDDTTAGTYLTDPRLVVYPLLGVSGLLLALRRGGWLLLTGMMLAVVVPPLLNGKYKPVMDGRYLMPLVPVLVVGIGCFGALIRDLSSRHWVRLVLTLLIALTAASLMSTSFARLDAYYRDAMADGASNQAYLRTLEALKANRQ